MSNEPRELTENEVRDRFLRHVWGAVREWQCEARRPTAAGKLEGLAFTLLAMLDGSNMTLPKFIVAPDPHASDRPFLAERGENYFPENADTVVYCDLGGSLHDHFHRVGREQGFLPPKGTT